MPLAAASVQTRKRASPSLNNCRHYIVQDKIKQSVSEEIPVQNKYHSVGIHASIKQPGGIFQYKLFSQYGYSQYKIINISGDISVPADFAAAPAWISTTPPRSRSTLKEGRTGRKEGRDERRKEGRKKGRDEGRTG
jgi:hypothetical protein